MSTKLVRYKDVCAALIPMIADMLQKGNVKPAIDTLKALGALEDADLAKAAKEYCDTQPEQRWIPVTERLPENDNEVLITVWDAEDDYVEVYKGFYQGHEWWTQWCHGCSKIKDEPCGENIVIAWMPLPEPYREERTEE